MTPDAYVESLERDGGRLVEAVASAPDASVTHCGDWTNADLARHVGFVWTVAATNVAAATDAPTQPGSESRAPDADGELIGWLEDRRRTVIDTLRGADPRSVAWSFAPDDHTAGFWQRRMAQETAMHRWDAQMAATGAPDPIDSDLARDGIDEYTRVGLRYSSSRPDRVYPTESLHLHCTDVDGEWMLVGDGGGSVTVTREHGKGDAAVRGPAADLLLWIWGRPTDAPEIFGDPDVADAWRALAP